MHERATMSTLEPKSSYIFAGMLEDEDEDAALTQLDAHEFLILLCEYLDLAEGSRLEDRLIEDAGFDSLQMYELIVLLEELGNAELEESMYTSIRTFEDAYRIYLELIDLRMRNA